MYLGKRHRLSRLRGNICSEHICTLLSKTIPPKVLVSEGQADLELINAQLHSEFFVAQQIFCRWGNFNIIENCTIRKET